MSIQIGYALSSEEFGPRDLVRQAERAERAGFGFASISDHYHPWVGAQGNSPFVWAVLGGIAGATNHLRVGTGVTCPTTRIHPAIIAQAAATAAAMLPGRFWLGVGAGENLNEHILGDPWPPADVRHERLEEAVEVIRELWKGELVNHRGRHFTVDNARLFTLPSEPPPIYVATGGEKATELAGRIGDGMYGLVADPEVVMAYNKAGGEGPKIGQVHVCWADDPDLARRTALEFWPNGALPGSLSWELPLPSQFEDAAELVDADDVAEGVVTGPDPEPYLNAIDKFIEAGYDHIYLHQIGPDQDGFLDFAEREIIPAFRGGYTDREPAADSGRDPIAQPITSPAAGSRPVQAQSVYAASTGVIDGEPNRSSPREEDGGDQET